MFFFVNYFSPALFLSMQGYFGRKFVNICSKFVKKLKKLVNGWCTINGQSSTFLSSLPRTLHQQFESYKQEVRRIGAETRHQQTQQKDDTPTCGICRKTKFADGCGHLCSYCQTKFCARCGGRVSLRSNNVRNPPSPPPLPFPLSHSPHSCCSWCSVGPSASMFVCVCFVASLSHFG